MPKQVAKIVHQNIKRSLKSVFNSKTVVRCSILRRFRRGFERNMVLKASMAPLIDINKSDGDMFVIERQQLC